MSLSLQPVSPFSSIWPSLVLSLLQLSFHRKILEGCGDGGGAVRELPPPTPTGEIIISLLFTPPPLLSRHTETVTLTWNIHNYTISQQTTRGNTQRHHKRNRQKSHSHNYKYLWSTGQHFQAYLAHIYKCLYSWHKVTLMLNSKSRAPTKAMSHSSYTHHENNNHICHVMSHVTHTLCKHYHTQYHSYTQLHNHTQSFCEPGGLEWTTHLASIDYYLCAKLFYLSGSQFLSL